MAKDVSIEEILRLRNEGYTRAEIAKYLGVSKGTICGRIQRHDSPDKVREYARRIQQKKKAKERELLEQYPQDHSDAPYRKSVLDKVLTRRRLIPTCCWSGCRREVPRGEPYCDEHRRAAGATSKGSESDPFSS